MNNLKFLYCHNHYKFPGGESLVFENEIKGLGEYGHPVTIYTRSNQESENRSFLERIKILGSGYYSYQTQKDITQLVKKEKPVVAIVQNVFPLISPSVYSTLKSLDIPIIQAVYNYRFVCPEGELYTHGQI